MMAAEGCRKYSVDLNKTYKVGRTNNLTVIVVGNTGNSTFVEGDDRHICLYVCLYGEQFLF